MSESMMNLTHEELTMIRRHREEKTRKDLWNRFVSYYDNMSLPRGIAQALADGLMNHPANRVKLRALLDEADTLTGVDG